ncbi:hypothetical protein [Tardiphaga sp.]|uniref:hypothetical protein n=1 Tax=Tardiphaga sp. TaxID=1926292 RepID=UPI00352BC65E
MLLLGALIGLFAQQAAFAAGPHQASIMPAKTMPATKQMPDDCAALMQKAPPAGEKPCKGLTLECIASMGCVIPIVAAPEQPLTVKVIYERFEPVAATASVLTGRVLAPDPEPPTLLI